MAKQILYRGQPGTGTTSGSGAISKVATIDAASVCNTTASPVTLDVYLVPSGSSAGPSNKVYSGLSIPANDQLALGLLVNQALNANDVIRFTASTPSALTVIVSGRTT